ncbi:MAG: Gfo/Idh/MocA family oxidoreductase, partial [Desulfatitalea sp.]
MANFPIVTDRKIRIAIVGCGRISKNHFGSLEKHAENIELAAICDIDPVVLKSHADKYRVPAYLHMEDMLKSERLDIVALCTPSGLHPDQAAMAARYGVNVVTEKPMATRWSDGVRMVRACDEAGVRLFVVKQNRRNTTLQLLKRAVEDKRFGKIHLVHLNVFWTRPQSYYDQAKWRGTWEFDGGAFMNQASHYVDLFDWLIGPVEKVQAMMSTTRDIEVEDTGVLNVRWRNGALGSMSVTMLTYPKNLEGSITILGERGTVRVGGVAVNDIQLWQFDEPCDYDEQIKAANYETTSVYGFG